MSHNRNGAFNLKLHPQPPTVSTKRCLLSLETKPLVQTRSLQSYSALVGLLSWPSSESYLLEYGHSRIGRSTGEEDACMSSLKRGTGVFVITTEAY